MDVKVTFADISKLDAARKEYEDAAKNLKDYRTSNRRYFLAYSEEDKYYPYNSHVCRLTNQEVQTILTSRVNTAKEKLEAMGVQV